VKSKFKLQQFTFALKKKQQRNKVKGWGVKAQYLAMSIILHPKFKQIREVPWLRV